MRKYRRSRAVGVRPAERHRCRTQEGTREVTAAGEIQVQLREEIITGPLSCQETGVTGEGVSDWERKVRNGLGEEKEGMGHDQHIGTMMWQEADMDIQKKLVQIVRKRKWEQSSQSQENQAKASYPKGPISLYSCE